jgi:hypothetical protein
LKIELSFNSTISLGAPLFGYFLAAEAGIIQGLSYRYFNSKEELFITLIQEAMEEANAAFENVNHHHEHHLNKLEL